MSSKIPVYISCDGLLQTQKQFKNKFPKDLLQCRHIRWIQGKIEWLQSLSQLSNSSGILSGRCHWGMMCPSCQMGSDLSRMLKDIFMLALQKKEDIDALVICFEGNNHQAIEILASFITHHFFLRDRFQVINLEKIPS